MVPAPEERRFAVLIGASEFTPEAGISNLRCPPADVEGMYDLLTSAETGIFPRETTYRLVNRTHYDITRHINGLCRRANRDDVLLIYYSGHGKQDAVGRLYLATADTSSDALESSSIAVDHLRNLLDLSHSRKVIIILDCCFSGAASKSFLRGSTDEQLKMFAHAQGTYLLTASTRTQAAEEKEGDTHAVFTKHLIAGVRSGSADLDRDGWVSMDELYAYVHRHVTTESHQEPERYYLAGRGDLVFARSPPVPLGGAESSITADDDLPYERRLKLFGLWSTAPTGIACTAAALSALDAFAAVGDEHGSLSIFDTRNGTIKERLRSDLPIWSMAFSPSGNHLAWVDSGPHVNVHDLKRHRTRVLLTDSAERITEVAFLSDSLLVSCTKEGTLTIVDLRDDSATTHLLLGGSVTALAVDAASGLVCIGASPNRLSLFNLATSGFDIDMDTIWPKPSRLTFLASGMAVAAGEVDGRVRIIDLATRSSVTEMGPLDGAISGLMFQPETNLLFAADGAHFLTVIDTTNWKVLGRFPLRRQVGALAGGGRSGLILVGFADGGVTLLRRYLSARPQLFVA